MQSNPRHRLLISMVLATSLLSAIFLYSRLENGTLPDTSQVSYSLDAPDTSSNSFLPDVAVAKMVVEKVIDIITISHL